MASGTMFPLPSDKRRPDGGGSVHAHCMHAPCVTQLFCCLSVYLSPLRLNKNGNGHGNWENEEKRRIGGARVG